MKDICCNRIVVSLIFTAILHIYPQLTLAQSPLNTILFIDSYAAISQNQLLQRQRDYFTQASENENLRLNLASFGIDYNSDLLRGKFVVQYGDSVNINYNAEPDNSLKFIQESYIGTYLSEKTNIDVGIFLAHIGAETWLSKDNLNYTRSLIAEFSPYYESGIRITHQFNQQWSAQILGINGWQNISDQRHPALGTQLNYTESDTSITSNSFFGSESGAQRLFHDLIITEKISAATKLIFSFDIGYQSNGISDAGSWWGYSLMAQRKLNQSVNANLRIEEYRDPNGLIVNSVTNKNFIVDAISIGLDFILAKGFLLRTEVKHLWSPNQVFLDLDRAKDRDTIFITSFSYAL